MKNKINKILKSKTPVIIIGTLVIAYLIFNTFRGEYYLSKYREYTIGKAIYTQDRGNSLFLRYIFYVKGEEYWGEEYLGDECGSCKVGRYFQVKYSYKKPGFSELYFTKEVFDTVTIKAAGFK